MSLIHRYKSNGFNIVLDINSGCIHLVDEVTYEVLPYLEEGLGTEAIAEKLENKYNREDIETLCDHVYMMDHGVLTVQR